MTGVEKITDRIAADAAKEAQAILGAAEVECRRLAEEYANRGISERDRIADRAEAEGQRMIDRAKSTADMNRRAIAMTPKTIRGKILAFLSQQQKKAGTRAFTIPYSQTKLASHLSVDRSALSNELSKLRREGVIDYEGRTYRLL